MLSPYVCLINSRICSRESRLKELIALTIKGRRYTFCLFSYYAYVCNESAKTDPSVDKPGLDN
jgi:hypothetical protein